MLGEPAAWRGSARSVHAHCHEIHIGGADGFVTMPPARLPWVRKGISDVFQRLEYLDTAPMGGLPTEHWAACGMHLVCSADLGL